MEISKKIPHELTIEESVLGAIIQNPNTLRDIEELFHEDLFFDFKTNQIAKAILSVSKQSKQPDLIQVWQWVQSNVKSPEIDLYYISTLTNKAVIFGIEEKIMILNQLWIKRKIIFNNSQILNSAYEVNSDVFELIGSAEKSLNEITNKISVSKTFTSTDCAIELDAHLNAIEKLDQNQLIGIDTGFRELNKLTSGWQKSDLIILAARPGMGKTSLALNFIHSALMVNAPCLIFSLEMSKLSIYSRLCSQLTGLPLNKFLTQKMNKEERNLYASETFKLAESPMFIEDKGGVDLNYIKIKARKLKRDKNIQFIVVDYLQFIDMGIGNNSTNDKVGAISKGLKHLAKELEIPIICLSQLSRKVEERADKRPMPSDLRDSGNIEQDADIIMFIYRPEFYGITDDGSGNSTIGKAEIIISKHRNGALGSVVTNFNGQCTNFYDNKSIIHTDYKALSANEDFINDKPF